MNEDEVSQKIENLYQDALKKCIEIYNLRKSNPEIDDDKKQEWVEDNLSQEEIADCIHSHSEYQAKNELIHFIVDLSEKFQFGWQSSSLRC